MIRVFSGSCLSLDEVDHVREVKFEERPHLLGPGVDYFTEDGMPLRPQLCAHTLNKVFSGSALDLNDMSALANESNDANGHSDHSGSLDEHAMHHPNKGGPADPTISTIIAHLSQESQQERARTANSKTNVLVVGAAGFLGSHVVARFLEAGYTVRATVDDMGDEELVHELYGMYPEGRRRLVVREVNIFNSQAFREVIRGCRFAVHCGVSAGAVRGFDNVAKAHTEAVQAFFDAVRTFGKPSIKRAVIIGSASAFATLNGPTTIREDIVKDPSLKTITEAGPLAKIAFVGEAVRLSRMVGVELTTLLPTIMLGPSCTRESSEGMRLLADLCQWTSLFPLAPTTYWNFVDVRDVAAVTVRAAEEEGAKNQTFIVANETMSISGIGRIVRKQFPHLKAPTIDAPRILTMAFAPLMGSRVSLKQLWRILGARREYDSQKAKRELSYVCTSMDITVRDAVQELIRHGFVADPSGKAPAARRYQLDDKTPQSPKSATVNAAANTASSSSLARLGFGVTVLAAASVAAAVAFRFVQKRQ